MSYSIRLAILLFLALAAYALPWLVTNGTALSPGAYDLAEWTTIHPLERISSPVLLTALLLRLPLVGLAALVGFSVARPVFRTTYWWVALISVGIITLSSLPPLEFFTENSADQNYRQQFLLSLAALLVGFAGLSGFFTRVRLSVFIASCALSVLVLIAGLIRARDLFNDMGLMPDLGPGAPLMLICFLLFAANEYTNKKAASQKI